MKNEVLIRASDVGKKFSSNLKKSMKYGVLDIARDFMGITIPSDQLREAEFWGLQDVTFEVKRGECLGLIGPNGAGKSTLLKMINGIIKPDKGVIEIHGKVGAMIEVGAGFHPLLTGRENVYINGSIMGLTKKELDKKFDSIVEFAELGDFIDTPVSYYSSGMYVRLGFAVAAHMEPDVLLIDEVLAVGDVGFRTKCYNRISELMQNCAVIFVSHYMPHVTKLCDNVVVLNKGKMVCKEKAIIGVDQYNDLFSDHNTRISGTGEAELRNLKILNEDEVETDEIVHNKSLQLVFDLKVSNKYDEYNISITFMSQDSSLIAQCHSQYNSIVLKNEGKPQSFKIVIDKLILNPGKYYVNIIIFDKTDTKHILWLYAASRFKIKGNFHGGAPIQFQADWRHSNK